MGALRDNYARQIPYLQAILYYFVSCINILLTRSQLSSGFKKRMCCHSFIALNKVSDVAAADWLSQTHTKNYLNFSCLEIYNFSQ